MSLALILTYATLVLLCTLALLWSRWPAWLKGLLVLGTTLLYFWGNDVVHNLSGWPSADTLPERFALLAVVIEEPTAKSAGALYLWVNAIDKGKPVAQPRAFKVAYTKDLHALLNESMKKARQGISQMGSAVPKAGKKGLGWLRPGSDEQEVKIRDLPAPQLPEK